MKHEALKEEVQAALGDDTQSSLGIHEGLVPGPWRIPKPRDAQVPYIKQYSIYI